MIVWFDITQTAHRHGTSVDFGVLTAAAMLSLGAMRTDGVLEYQIKWNRQQMERCKRTHRHLLRLESSKKCTGTALVCHNNIFGTTRKECVTNQGPPMAHTATPSSGAHDRNKNTFNKRVKKSHLCWQSSTSLPSCSASRLAPLSLTCSSLSSSSRRCSCFVPSKIFTVRQLTANRQKDTKTSSLTFFVARN